jgi:hypothetical protein
MKTPTLPASLLATAIVLAACSHQPAAPVAQMPDAEVARQPADAFMDRIRSHCGQAFAGRIIADTPPPTGADAFAGKALVMHVRGCKADELRVPFHVGEDRSRTWILTRTASGVRLKHDHRHEDGTPDTSTMYGGDTVSRGSALRQEFPVDADSVVQFEASGRTASTTNTWAMEIEPGQRLLYELSRPGGRLFQVEFDLTKPIDPPPAPWGHD